MDLKNIVGNIIFSASVGTVKELVSAAIRSGADLQYADLRSADLRSANLRGANLRSADLRSANLRGADLQGVNLQYADLRSADLQYANLQCADLQYANLRGANLRGADLQGVNLQYANLQYANLRSANLRSADLQYANNIPALAEAQSNILPDGVIIGWKKCQNNVIVKLLISAKTPRSNATGRKCRAQSARVVDVFGAEIGVSQRNASVTYRKGQIVTCHEWCADRWRECAGGIHFYITRIEAENHN